MKQELAPLYDPKAVEDRIYSMWEEKGCFRSTPDSRRPYTIVIPPPNVTGVLHMGHALNLTIQDVLIRFRRMQGFNALWLPGTDHAGIATQNVVEKDLASRGLSREDVGRGKFLEEVWKWKEECERLIMRQLKKLGSSCDWARTRFTLDEGLSRAVREAFVQLYEQGLIYKGLYIIHWCPRCQTALSDDEVDHIETEGHLWYLRYPFKGARGFVTVATTRPETMLGDVAVAVNPRDKRYKEMVGKILVLPLVKREIPVIADEAVELHFGTGAVKVTPAHDPSDFLIGERHGLEPISVMNLDGSMNSLAGAFAGLDRFQARKEVVSALEKEGLLEKIEPYKYSVGHCYRCESVLEPTLSLQLFVRMRPLAECAIEASREGKVTFHPDRWERVYLSWLENVRDWCISRQIWWGHRIPAYYCRSCEEMVVARETPISCPKCRSREFNQDEDVLDTWFSSALWPFSTLGWPDAECGIRGAECGVKSTPSPQAERPSDLGYYFPTDVLVTDRGIIYFWVARMVMMGLVHMNEVPFHDVYIHGTILDELGRKMSKSLGNGIDPIEMIEKYSADAVRFSLVMLTVEGQDLKLSASRFEMGRNFCNKLWNAARLVLGFLPEGVDLVLHPGPDELGAFEDRWILSRMNGCIQTVTESLERFQFNPAASALYDFLWHDFCDWYLEIIKPRLRGEGQDALSARKVAALVLDRSLRLLHPIIPFVTEALWEHLNRTSPRRSNTVAPPEEPLATSPWPLHTDELSDERSEEEMSLVQSVVRAVRLIRNQHAIDERKPLEAIVGVADADALSLLSDKEALVKQLAFLESLLVSPEASKPEWSAREVVGPVEVCVPLRGVMDPEVERLRLQRKLDHLGELLKASEAKLGNQQFLRHAPQHIVQGEKDRHEELLRQYQKTHENLQTVPG